jgi:hypothetical protein
MMFEQDQRLMIRSLSSRSRDLDLNKAVQDRLDQLREIADLESRLARVKAEIVGRIRRDATKPAIRDLMQ